MYIFACLREYICVYMFASLRVACKFATGICYKKNNLYPLHLCYTSSTMIGDRVNINSSCNKCLWFVCKHIISADISVYYIAGIISA